MNNLWGRLPRVLKHSHKYHRIRTFSGIHKWPQLVGWCGLLDIFWDKNWQESWRIWRNTTTWIKGTSQKPNAASYQLSIQHQTFHCTDLSHLRVVRSYILQIMMLKLPGHSCSCWETKPSHNEKPWSRHTLCGFSSAGIENENLDKTDQGFSRGHPFLFTNICIL